MAKGATRITIPTRQRSQADQNSIFDPTFISYLLHEAVWIWNEIIYVKFWTLIKVSLLHSSSQSNIGSSVTTQGEQNRGTYYYMPSPKATLLGLTFGPEFAQKGRMTEKVGNPLCNMLNVLHDPQKSDSHMLTWIWTYCRHMQAGSYSSTKKINGWAEAIFTRTCLWFSKQNFVTSFHYILGYVTFYGIHIYK